MEAELLSSSAVGPIPGRGVRLPGATLYLTGEDVSAYLKSLEEQGRSSATVSCYATKLAALRAYLGDEPLGVSTLLSWRSHLLEEGYSPRTVNTYISAANGLVGYLGRRDLQLIGQLHAEGNERSCLTRREYLTLLSYARDCGRERDYLLVKTFALTGISPLDLPRVTVEAAACGEIWLEGKEAIHMPRFLSREILSFASAEGIEEGPVFRGKDGRLLSRTAAAACLRNLARAAGLHPERCGPGALSSLRSLALHEIKETLAPIVSRTYESLLDAEQVAVGWDDASSGRESKQNDPSNGLGLAIRDSKRGVS